MNLRLLTAASLTFALNVAPASARQPVRDHDITLDDYFTMSERCIKKAREVGIDMCGTVSTIWGSPIRGHEETTLKRAVEFSKRYLELESEEAYQEAVKAHGGKIE